ncbi:MAG: hypothetical protein ABR972_14910, partial [Acidimicrobiales bacterium]
TVSTIGKPVGGARVGQHNSLAQYLAGELSRQIRRQGTQHPVEGAFMGNQDIEELRYRDADGEPITSSLTDSGFDLSLFRLRAQ